MGTLVGFTATIYIPGVHNFHSPIHGHVYLTPSDDVCVCVQVCAGIVSPRSFPRDGLYVTVCS
jgi:hypothetical protein